MNQKVVAVRLIDEKIFLIELSTMQVGQEVLGIS